MEKIIDWFSYINKIVETSDNFQNNKEYINEAYWKPSDNNMVIDCQYDMDTPLGMPNYTEIDPYWKDKNGYCGYEYDECYTSKEEFGPRGEYYNLVLIKDNKIIAFGDEQGNYCGGVYAATDFNYQQFLTEKDYLKKEYPELYNKIKDIPLATENEYPMRK
jgi:hypothetical protein